MKTTGITGRKAGILYDARARAMLLALKGQRLYPTLSTAEKVAGKNVRCAWSIPAGPKHSCIGATHRCTFSCYARAVHYLYDPAQRVMARNWAWLRSYEKKGDFRTPARQLADMIMTLWFRIHSSGDFHSQWAVFLWAAVAKLRRDVKFWAYTRSFSLDFRLLLEHKNTMLWASSDRDNRREAARFQKRYEKYGVQIAYGPWDSEDQRRSLLGTGEPTPENSFICPVYIDGALPMSGACVACKLCLLRGRTRRSVVFPEHIGGQKNRILTIDEWKTADLHPLER